MTKVLKNIAHERADYAFQCAKKASNNQNYRAYIRRLPIQIKTNGLAQTMAFFYSKKEDAYKSIYKELEVWIKEKRKMLKENSNQDFVIALVNEEPASYRAITMEVLSILEWWKRFVEALIEDDESSK